MTTSPQGALARAALALLMFVTLAPACAPEFSEDECSTNADCFNDEVCGAAGLCIQAPPPAEASVVAFTASPETINPGDEVTLSWTLTDAASAVISTPGVEDTVIPSAQLSSGSLTVTPADTVTYTITATSADDISDDAEVTVTVEQIPAPEVTTFASTPETIEAGGSSTLSWEITGATAAVITAGGQTVHTVPEADLASGSFAVSPEDSTTYTLTASSDGGDDTSTTSVTIQGVGPVIDTFAPAPDTVIQGQSVRLAWTITGADSIELVDGAAQPIDVSGVDVADGSVEVPINTAQATFTLRAINEFDTTIQTVSVTGVPVLDISSFTATPAAVPDGGEVTLSWSIEGNPDDVTLTEVDSDGTRAVDLSGVINVTNASLILRPTLETTYTLDATAAAPAQVDSAQAVVTILPPLPTVIDFAASASEIAVNGDTTLTWSANGAASIALTDDGGNTYDLTGKDLDSDSILIQSIPVSRVFTFTATNAAGDSVASTTVSTGDVVTATIVSDRAMILENEEVILTWTSTNATSIEITGPSGTPLDLGTQPLAGGDVTVSPLTSPTSTYTITAQGFGGPISRDVVITVDPRVNATFFSSEVIVPVETPARDVTLTWTTSAAMSLTIDALAGGVTTAVDISNTNVASDSVVVNPVETTVYTLTALGFAGDEATAQITVEVYEPADVISFTASASTIDAGETTRLSWQTSGATGLSITDSSTGLPIDLTGKSLDADFIDVRLENSTLFSLTATGANASNDNASQIITVRPAPLQITEIMYNPSGSDDQKEWVELYNAGDNAIDLSNYSLGAGASDYSATTLTLSGVIPARGCVVVGGPTSSADNGNPGIFDQEADLSPDLEDQAGVAIVYNGDPSGSELVDTVVYGAAAPGLLGEMGGQDNEVSPGVMSQGSSIARVSSTTDVFEVLAVPTPGRCLQLSSATPVAPQVAPTGASGQVTVAGYALTPDLVEISIGATTLSNCAAGASPDTITCDYAPSPAEVGAVALTATRAFDYTPDGSGGVNVTPRGVPAQVAESVADAFFFTDTIADPGASFGCSIDFPGVTSSQRGTPVLLQGRVFVAGVTDAGGTLPAGTVVELGYVRDGELPWLVFDAVTEVATLLITISPDATFEAGANSQEVIDTNLFMRVSLDGGDSFVYCDGVPASYGSDDGYATADTFSYDWTP